MTSSAQESALRVLIAFLLPPADSCYRQALFQGSYPSDFPVTIPSQTAA